MNCFLNGQRCIRWFLTITLLVLLVPCLPLVAGQKKKAHPVRKSSAHRRRHSRSYRRYTHVRIQPARVKEIQQALIKTGFLHHQPDGVWGPTTRDAMKQFQKQNGFTPTGLPEAKPLMLLGLGPHPLPPGLGPLPPAVHEVDSDTAGDTQPSVATASPTATKPTSSN